MRADRAKLWVEELRSGKYEQAQASLRTEDDKFCCLGVLCELAVAEGILEPPTLQGFSRDYYYQSDGFKTSTYLPESVQKWAGMSTRAGEFNVNDSLAERNDNGMDFNGIADLIEKHRKEL